MAANFIGYLGQGYHNNQIDRKLTQNSILWVFLKWCVLNILPNKFNKKLKIQFPYFTLEKLWRDSVPIGVVNQCCMLELLLWTLRF